MLFSSGEQLWNEVCGPRLRKLGRNKDHSELFKRLLMCFSKFVNVDHYIPFLELHRKALKVEKKIKGNSEDFLIVKALKNAIDCHISLKSGSWSNAVLKLLSISSVKPIAGQEVIFDSLPPSSKTDFVNFAFITVMLMKFSSCYLPDYALFFLDSDTNFCDLYRDSDVINLLRQRSSLLR